MTGDDARKAVGREAGGGERDPVEGEWGEKVERVFEFLCDTGGLRRRERRFEEVVEGEGQQSGLTLPMSSEEGMVVDQS